MWDRLWIGILDLAGVWWLIRRKKPTPYMEGLHFTPGDRGAADPDTRMLSDEDLERAKKEGESRG